MDRRERNSGNDGDDSTSFYFCIVLGHFFFIQKYSFFHLFLVKRSVTYCSQGLMSLAYGSQDVFPFGCCI